MLKRLEIDPEFKNLIPPLSPDEYKQLEENLINEGCRDSLVVWEGVIIDGHNRYEICNRELIPFGVKEMYFDERGEVIEWIIRNQFGRRNMPAYTRGVLALRLEDEIKARAKVNQGSRNDLNIPQKSAKSTETRKEVAKIAGVSHDTISKVKVIEEKATPEQKEALHTGKKKINTVFRDVKEAETGTRVCSDCGEEKALEDFTPNSKGGRELICRSCRNKKRRMDIPGKISDDKINAIYSEMKNPGQGDDQGAGINEKFCNSIITEFEEIIKCFAADINKFLFSEEQISKAPLEVKKMVESTINDLNKINKFIKE